MRPFIKSKLAAATSALALSVALLGSATLFTQRAEAQIPVTDAGSLMQMIQDGIMRAMESEIMQTIEETKLDLMSLFSELEIDNVNNAIGNMIVRTGKAMQDIQNTEQLEKSMPAQDVCDTLSMAANLDDLLCGMESQSYAENVKKAGARAMASGKSTVVCPPGVTDTKLCTVVNRAPSVEEVSKYNATKSSEIVNKCKAIADAVGSDACSDPSILISPPPQGATDQQYMAMKKQIELAVNPIIKAPYADHTMDSLKGTAAHDKALVIDQRATNFRAGIESALNHNLMLQHGTYNEATKERAPGEVFLLDKYLAERLGSENWMCEVTNTCKGGDKAPYVAPAELEKRKIQMDAVMLYINLQQYKSSLRIEKTLADIALLELDHPTK